MLPLALRIAAIAKSKKAIKVVVLDMRSVANFCDYFVILSGTSLRHINALAKAIQEDLSRPCSKSQRVSKQERDLEKDRIKALSKGYPHDDSGWIVLDYASVVVHIFLKTLREFYSLERLWQDAKRVRLSV